MASKAVSPTANLLRNSRLFSLPQRLSEAPIQPLSRGGEPSSDTATKPHPFLQTIETTSAGLHRGDWGLKRPLPKKKTQNTSTPVIRVNEIDSIDHVTDYDSASDHYLTLRKWQELNIPLVHPQDASNPLKYNTGTSVFEEPYHTTSPDSTNRATRWKFKGPWLNGLTPGQFRDYINSEIKSRRGEFHAYAKAHILSQRSAAARSAGKTANKPNPPPSPLTDADFAEEMSRLRNQPASLNALIWAFLDLPGIPPGGAPKALKDAASEYISPFTRGPPRTHPSAGLGYIRTNNVIPNHPVLGPIRYQPPVEGRILSHGGAATRRTGTHMVGIAGVVARVDKYSGMTSGAGSAGDPGRNQEVRFEAGLRNGAKSWVQPLYASIGPSGRVQMEAQRAQDDAVAVWEHRVDKKDPRRSVGQVFGGYGSGMALDELRRANLKGRPLREVGLRKKPAGEFGSMRFGEKKEV